MFFMLSDYQRGLFILLIMLKCQWLLVYELDRFHSQLNWEKKVLQPWGLATKILFVLMFYVTVINVLLMDTTQCLWWVSNSLPSDSKSICSSWLLRLNPVNFPTNFMPNLTLLSFWLQYVRRAPLNIPPLRSQQSNQPDQLTRNYICTKYHWTKNKHIDQLMSHICKVTIRTWTNSYMYQGESHINVLVNI